ncbi:thrombospondin type-1 domain-containing protein 1 [Canis lupus familiaris]|uniref:Thrombospondin type 1 domain containing 1 n=2 Tax=Canis lupus familiaris TaxID=9615 RepID=A0A8P0SBE0_CANLF|nr:thrombospondin type-1 domain-containing protein 1 [Canis lupus familiaris]XP_038290633.1 thrombospondin type-1 domain-containing protein 1 [Canis lupus familiaris]XP_038290634.1 thrombospondin type-1 domain-containing protein 1 [Canis lupus familiaris]XP_038429057.1 thrombospondin type-1 domain-containing protein 1 [Canis lupus familiaris]XP_038429058.1 thrombospondin type-1 domain-containing protein 1 [Canis lupus familiaris]XP_534485.2 thrombospondin type-1 domain-containing protein 1 [Ca|eukprot:XP_005635457.1 thrombospondin type-1 domain-containing protein 1 [Canis lupus familiaris]
MKQMLKDFSNLLLVVLCDYVLGEADYLLLGKPGHVALSNSTVSVDFRYFSGANGTLRNVSILLLEANTNQTVITKYLLTNQSQGTLEFECFYFKEAGDYWFTMTPDAADNSTPVHQWEQSAFLKVKWPVFHIDLNRTSKAMEGTFQVGLFTSQPLCSFPVDQPDILVDVIFTNSLPEARTSPSQPLEIRSSKRTELSQGQWVEFGCAPVGPEAYVTVVLKLLGRDSIITSTGPIDLAQKFGYKLVMVSELTCESRVEVMVLPPPCIFVQGVITVFKEAPRRPGERTIQLAENSLMLGERKTVFNCTLFDMGRNKYCFDFDVSSRSHFSAKERECMLIQRNIETWGLWQPWSQCSATCGDGVRERRRVCLTPFPSRPGCPGMSLETSLCSLEECAALQPSSVSPLQPQGPGKSNNVVTITGISLCLFIIVATVVVTLWRRFGRAPECGPPARRSSVHSPGCRKHSDEETICEPSGPRGSFSDAGDGPAGGARGAGIPLGCRRSRPAGPAPGPEDDASGSESLQASAQKIIPPLFSYRLAQQQLKEMKKKGLTETTKVYHVSQNPLTDTAVDAAAGLGLGLGLGLESPDGAAADTFRIKSPFPEQPVGGAAAGAPCGLDFPSFPASRAVSPSQTVVRKSAPRHVAGRGVLLERSHPKGSHFRRTSSFHEAKQARPFRERSLSTLTPRQAPTCSARTRTWDQADDRFRPQSRGAALLPEKPDHFQGAGATRGPLSPLPKSYTLGQPARKPDLGDCQAGFMSGGERMDPHRAQRGPSPSHRSVSRKQLSPAVPKDSYQRVSPLSPSQCRRDKCQSFPAHPEFAFYDNTSFGLTEAEQRMLDLPGYIGSNEEDETTSTLSVEKLVI